MKALRLVLILSSLFLFVACRSAEPAAQTQEMATETEAMADVAGKASEADMPMPAAEVRAEAAASEPQAGQTGASGPAAIPQWNRKIIKNAQLSLKTEEVFQALNQATLISNQYGGYVVNSRTWYEKGYPYAVYAFAVPVDQFELALEQIRQLGEVRNETSTGQDVTDQYVDLEARIHNLEVTAARVHSFLDETETIEEALVVNAELNRIEEQLERLKGQFNALGQQTAFSTISLEIVPVIPPVDSKPELGWSAARTFTAAITVIIQVSQRLIDILIWILVLGLPLFLIFLPFWLLVRRLGFRVAQQ